jgi:D-glycero-D-manno-heptose 1,7-bisphosphate phosphatase
MNVYEHPTLPFGAKIDSDGIWCQILNRVPDRHPRPALFLDRDGVIVEEMHHLSRIEDVHLIDGAAHVIGCANKRNIPVIIITNQSGIGRGKFKWQNFIDVQEQILKDLDAKNVFVNAVFACPFHADGRSPYQHPNHPCRKPNPGMIEKAGLNFSVDKKSSWIIGDRGADLKAGKHGGLAGGIHVSTGHGVPAEQDQSRLLKDQNFDVFLSASIANVVDHLNILN